MKSFFYSLLTAMCLLVTVSIMSEAKAQEVVKTKDPDFYSHFYVMQIKPMQFKITYHYPNMDRVRVRIIDGHGDVLFIEKALVYKKYQKLFDLSNFNDGQYTFELIDGAQEFRQSFDITTKTTRIVTAENNKSIIVAGF